MERKIEYWEAVDGYKGPKKYKAPSKYQASKFDTSMFLPYKVMVSELERKVGIAHDYIQEVYLIDVLDDESAESRALTVRCIVQSYDKTLSKNEVNDINKIVCAVVKGLGAKIR